MEPFGSYGQDEFEERAIRREVKRFEEMDRGLKFHFFDLVTLDEIFFWYMNQNRLQDALKVLNHALERNPGNDEIYFRKATVLFDCGEMEEAENGVLSAIEINPEAVEYHFLYAEILTLSGKYEEAVTVLKKMLYQADDPAEVYYQMGLVAQMSGVEEEAESYFKAALSEDPQYEEAATELAFHYEAANRFLDAIAVYESFLNENPFSYQAWFNLGSLQARTGDHEGALASLDFCLAINEDFSHGWFRKGVSLMEVKRFDEAIQCFLESSVMDKPDMPTWYNIAECYENLGNTGLARKYFLKCSGLAPERSEPWVKLGDILAREEKFLEAIHFYRKGLTQARDTFEIWLGLATCEYKLGNPVSAGEALEKAAALRPHEFKLWKNWAQTLKEDDNLYGALLFLLEGLKSNPLLAELYFMTGAYYFLAGSSDKGLSMIENGLLIDYSKHSVIFEACPELEALASVKHLLNQYRPC